MAKYRSTHQANCAIRRGVVAFGIALVIAGTSGFAQNTLPATCNNPFTPQQEVTEGAKVAAQVYQQMPVLPENDPVSQYVAQLGAHVVSHAPGQKWPYTFHVVASPDINAFALPGGSIFVNVGTLQAAQTEAQFAGVLAHETSHVVLRHSTCNMKKQQTTNLLAGVGSIASRILLGSGSAGQLGEAIIGASNGLYGLRMSRDDEKQADLLGTHIMYDTGYDPRGLPQFFEIIQAKYGAGGSQLLTDHPNPGNRTEYVDAEIAKLPRLSNPMVTSAAFTRMHSAAVQSRTFTAQQVKDGAWKSGSYAAGPGQSGPGQAGTVAVSQNGQAPNQPGSPTTAQYGADGPVALTRAQLGVGARMTTLRALTFQINAPANWQAASGANGIGTVAPVGGVGAFGLVYGAVIGKAQANSVADEDSLAIATQKLAQEISQENGGLRQLTLIQSMNLNGKLANGMELRGRSPLVENGAAIPEHEWLVAMSTSDGDLHYIIFVAPERDFAAMKPMFQTMLNSFRPQ